MYTGTGVRGMGVLKVGGVWAEECTMFINSCQPLPIRFILFHSGLFHLGKASQPTCSCLVFQFFRPPLLPTPLPPTLYSARVR